MGPAQREFLRVKLEALEEAGVIERITGSEWASPAFLVRKPGGDLTKANG